MSLDQANIVFTHADVTVIGWNPENADFSNPRGEKFGFRGYVLAEAPDGSRWVFNRTHIGYHQEDVYRRLESFVAKVQSHLDAGGTLDARYWRATRPAYGSVAYDQGGWSAIDAEAERNDENNF